MASGGARARSGPAPDPNALRRARDHAEWTTLPVAGRAGDPPPWPLEDQEPGEAARWASEWARPQAVMWERNGQHFEVALYVRAAIRSLAPDAPAAAGALVQRKMNDLGLTVPGLRANRWRIPGPDAAGDASSEGPKPERPAARKPARARSAKERLKVVGGQGA
jgi:hypothetical protein